MARLTSLFTSFFSASEPALFLIQNVFQIFIHPRFIVREDGDLFRGVGIVHTDVICLWITNVIIKALIYLFC